MTAAPWEASVGAEYSPSVPSAMHAQPQKQRGPIRVLLVIALGIVVFIVLGFAALPLITAPGVAREEVGSWEEYHSTKGGYSVRLPTQPTEKSQASASGARSLTVFSAETLYKGRNFGAAFFDLGPGDPSEYTFDYNAAVDGIAQRQQAQVLQRGSIQVSGRSGFFAKLKNREPGFFNKAYLVRAGNRVFVVMVEAYADREEQVVDAFLNSFRITN